MSEEDNGSETWSGILLVVLALSIILAMVIGLFMLAAKF